ncbi:MAG: hypothetical protein ACOYK1_03975 [Vampirovibrionia bacterium]|jgi:hypothetical protein
MIIVCSAWEEETKYLDLCQDKFKIIHLGIGYLQAALNLQRFILKDEEAENGIMRQTSVLSGGYLPQIEKIYFIGTAGLISEADINWDMPVFSVNKVSLSLPLSLKKQAYVPKTYPEFILKTGTELNVADCLSSLEITSSSEISSEIERVFFAKNGEENKNVENGAVYRPLLENMELYGVAQVAEEFNIPCSAILGVTNRIDASAHQDWISNHERVSKLLCDYFSELVQD